jgi:putative peptidoglycan lipid II flippase
MSRQTAAVPHRARTAAESKRAAKSFLGHAKLIGVLTLASRILGLGREIVAGHYLGTGLVASAFTVAFTIPNLFRKLFGEGALSAAFIPLYTQAVKHEREAQGLVNVSLPDGESSDGKSADRSSNESGFSRSRFRRATAGKAAKPQAAPDSVSDLSRSTNDSALGSTAHSALSTQHSALPQSNAFAAAAVNLLCIILLAITVIGEILLGAIILFSRDIRPETLLTVKLTAVMLPYVLLICGGAFISGILQVHKRFGPPAAAPIILNVCHIVVLLIGAKMLHLRASTPADQVIEIQTKLAFWLAGFVLVAGVLQVCVLLPALRQVGFRFQLVLHFWTPMIRKMLWLTLPVAIGAGVLQLSVLLDKGISMALMAGVDNVGNPITHFHFFGHLVRYPMALGAPRRLDLAQFLYQFPLGIFAIALATAIFPHLSSDALEKDRKGFTTILRQGIEAAMWEGLPASVGLVMVRMPAIRLLFQHGQLQAEDARLIGTSVLYYASAIWAFSVLQIVNRAYYALHDTVTPLVMAIVNILLNLIVEIPLLWWLGESAMAVGTLVSFVIQTVIMVLILDRKVGGLNLRQSIKPILKMVIATAVMGLACYDIKHLSWFPHGAGRISWAMQLVIIMAVGAAMYLGACWLLGLDMIGQLKPTRQQSASA